MRITGGTARGRGIAGPKSGCSFIRPTGDRVREALFSILAAEVPGSIVLDLYAGTGAFGIEALSREAEAVVFVDQSKRALQLIQANLTGCFAASAVNKVGLFKIDLARPDSITRLHNRLPSGLHFDLIFLDPPYEKKLAAMTLEMVEQSCIVRENGLVIAEERKSEQLPGQCGRLALIDQRSYGETKIWIYRQTGKTPPSSFSEKITAADACKYRSRKRQCPA